MTRTKVTPPPVLLGWTFGILIHFVSKRVHVGQADFNLFISTWRRPGQSWSKRRLWQKVCWCWGRGIGIIMKTQQERTCSLIHFVSEMSFSPSGLILDHRFGCRQPFTWEVIVCASIPMKSCPIFCGSTMLSRFDWFIEFAEKAGTLYKAVQNSMLYIWWQKVT